MRRHAEYIGIPSGRQHRTRHAKASPSVAYLLWWPSSVPEQEVPNLQRKRLIGESSRASMPIVQGRAVRSADDAESFVGGVGIDDD
jgi:hypothetical protein